MNAMKNYNEIILGKQAFEYVDECLNWGLSLTKYVRSTFNIYEGQITVSLPDRADLASINDFRDGGVLPTAPESEWRYTNNAVMKPVDVYIDYAIYTILDYLAVNTNRVCIFEDVMAHRGDRCLRNDKLSQFHYAFYGEEVYAIVQKQEATYDYIANTIRFTSAAVKLTGFLTSLPAGVSGIDELSLDLIIELASNIEKMIFQAYDAEAFIVWTRKESPKFNP
jgi:hypothetical protein